MKKGKEKTRLATFTLILLLFRSCVITLIRSENGFFVIIINLTLKFEDVPCGKFQSLWTVDLVGYHTEL